jgi:uncharacterized protein
MIRSFGWAALLALAAAPAAPAMAQMQPTSLPVLSGTRLDVVGMGEVVRIPDVVRVTAGVSTQAPTAAEALRRNSALMARARAALVSAGIADRDVQTLTLQLRSVYRNEEEEGRQVTGYRATNTLIVRFREVASAGRVLDALVAEGVNEIQGPMLDFDDVGPARDEARTLAIADARARATLYARALGMRVKRIVFVGEGMSNFFGSAAQGIVNMQANDAGTSIDPGGRKISAMVNVIFELE